MEKYTAIQILELLSHKIETEQIDLGSLCFREEIKKEHLVALSMAINSFKKSNEGIYVVEYGSHYDSDPWENIGYANTKEEAQEFINKQFCSSLYHCRELKHVSKVKEN